MEETYPTKAIILKREDFRERDSKVTLYSVDKGLLTLIARGTKKISSKLAGHIEPITLAQIMVVRGKRLDYIGSAVSQESYLGIKNELNKVQAAGEACKTFSRQIKSGEVDKDLYKLLYNFFSILNKPSVKPEKSQLVLHFFILKLLVILGFQPELYKCMDDNKPIKPGKNCFNLHKGGLVCGHCPRDKYHLTISDNCIKILRLALKEDFVHLNKLNVDKELENQIRSLVSQYYKYQLE